MFGTKFLGRALVLGGFIAASSVLSTSDADAAPSLKLTTGGGASVTVVDEGAGDAQPGILGVVQYDGAIGDFNVQVTIGTSKPAIGTATNPILKISNTSINILNNNADTLTIEFSETGFIGSGQTTANSDIGGSSAVTGGGTLTVMDSFTAFIDPTNTIFGQPGAGQVASIGPLSGPGFSGLDSGTVDLGAGPVTYSITQKFVVTAGTPGSNLSFDATTQIPVPATFGMLGIALFGLGVALRRRRA